MKTSTFHTYEPEDLERLMRTKSFEELLPEERAFVLRHVESSEEYGQVRALMIEVEGTDHDLYDPPAAVWKNLQREFRNQKKSLFVHWLNVLAQRWSEFTSLQRVAYTGVAFAGIATLLALPYYKQQDAQLAPVVVAENKVNESVQPELKNSVPNVTVPAVSNDIQLNQTVTEAENAMGYPEDVIVAAPVMADIVEEAPVDRNQDKVATTADSYSTFSVPSSTLPANASISNYTFSNSENLKLEATTITSTNAKVTTKTKAEVEKDSIAKTQSKSVPVKKKKKKKTTK